MWSIANPRVPVAAVCLVIALVYMFLWPGRKNPERLQQSPFWQRIVLRWFHSLTWVFIAIACLLWSRLPAIAACAIYLIFMIAARKQSTASR
jgi:hypothetical protein